MRRWMRVLGSAALAATLLGGTAAAEDLLEDFLVLGADPDDFRPSSEVVSSGSLLFVGGSTTLTDRFPSGDAAIVALDSRDGRVVWRDSEGEVGVAESFSVVGTAGGRVCAAATMIKQTLQTFSAQLELLVACYRTKRGQRLWVRRIEVAPMGYRLGFFGPAAPRLHVSKHAVVVSLSLPARPSSISSPRYLVLRFDPKDGTGQ